MKKNWKEAPPAFQRRIENLLAAQGTAAECWAAAASVAWSAGYDIDAPPQAATEQLARLRQIDPGAAGRFTQTRSIELADERMAKQLYAGRRAWAAGPSNEELVKRAAAERVEAERDAAIAARTQEIVRERAELTEKAARKQAEKELANVDA